MFLFIDSFVSYPWQIGTYNKCNGVSEIVEFLLPYGAFSCKIVGISWLLLVFLWMYMFVVDVVLLAAI